MSPDFHERSCQRKRRYWTEVDAIIAAEKRKADGEAKKLRAYLCKLCDGWHLTSAPKVYVDDPVVHAVRARANRRLLCCHLFTDGELEGLHKFAVMLSLKLEWFQPVPYPHYDLIGLGIRKAAVSRGAIEVDRKEAIRILRIAMPKESISHLRKGSDGNEEQSGPV